MCVCCVGVQVSGKYKDVPGPVDMSALFTVGGVSSTGFLFPFKIGAEVTIQVRHHNCTGCAKHMWAAPWGAGCAKHSKPMVAPTYSGLLVHQAKWSQQVNLNQ